jgi:hypothetical protein
MKDYLKNVKLDIYWKKEKRETRNKAKRRRTQSYEIVVSEMETGRTDFVGD